jgi:hypothetical protein
MEQMTLAERQAVRAEVRAARDAAQQACIRRHADLFRHLREASPAQRHSLSRSTSCRCRLPCHPGNCARYPTCR